MRRRSAGTSPAPLLLVAALLVLAAPQARALRGQVPHLEPGVASAGPASPQAARAAAFALDQRGKPYRWGAEGPGSFDCSGLTFAAYRAAGVSLPRTAREQFHYGGPRVRGRLARGDLVFFRSRGPSGWHVGLALDGRRMVEAPRSGAVVRIAPIDRPGYLGAVRPATQGGG